MMRFYPIKVPDHAHPLVKRFIEIRNQERAPTKLITKRAGLGRDTIKGWLGTTMPNVANLDAALNVLGYTLDIRKIK